MKPIASLDIIGALTKLANDLTSKPVVTPQGTMNLAKQLMQYYRPLSRTDGEFLMVTGENRDVVRYCKVEEPGGFSYCPEDTKILHVDSDFPEWCEEHGIKLWPVSNNPRQRKYRLIPKDDDAAFHFKMRFDVTLTTSGAVR